MSEIDYTLRDYRYPNEGYDGCETFAGVLRTFFPRWCADGKAAGLPKSWLPATAEEYAMHYLNFTIAGSKQTDAYVRRSGFQWRFGAVVEYLPF